MSTKEASEVAAYPPSEDPFWEGLRDGRLVLQHCSTCEYVRWPVADRCPECGTVGGSWSEVDGTGKLWSFATYRQRLGHQYPPYVVGLVQLPAGLSLLGVVVGPVSDNDIDSPVRVEFERVDDHLTRPVWRVIR